MIKNIIFDIGNVLTYYTWYEHIHSFGFPEEVCERITAATVKHPDWSEFDRGALQTEEIIDLMAKNDLGVEGQIRQMLSDITGLVSRADYAIPWICELKEKGYKVYYLSNFSEKAHVECSAALDFIPYMDGGILSYQEKVVKPEPEIYERLLEKYDLKARECVFLDDMQVNIDGAKRAGMEGILFTTKEEALPKLEMLGVK